jgi:hypothetical protein
MVIAALISFGILLLAWILAPEAETQQTRCEPQSELVGMAVGDAQLVGADRLALERS